MRGTYGLGRLTMQSMMSSVQESKTASLQGGVNNLKQQIRVLEDGLGKAMLINEALWELIRDRLNLTEEDLHHKLYEIDMRDGVLDEKNQRSGATVCPECKRKVSPRHASCLYCGAVIDKSVFDL